MLPFRFRTPLAASVAAALVVALLASVGVARASVTRGQAARIALSALHPSRRDDHLVVFGLPTPVRAGARVFADTPSLVGRGGGRLLQRGDDARFRVSEHPLAHPAWLFFEDLEYGATTEQAGILVLVDVSSGRVVRREPVASAPLLDGRPLAFDSSASAYDTQRNAVLSEAPRLAAAGRPRRLARTAAHAAATIVPPNYFTDDCLVTIGDRLDVAPGFGGDLADIEGWAYRVGMRVYNAPAGSRAIKLRVLIDKIATQAGPCHNIVVAVAGHGSKAPGTPDPLNPTSAALTASGTVQPSILLTKSVTAQGVTTRHYLTANDITGILSAHPQTQFELLLSSCFSGRFIPVLTAAQQASKLDNLLLIATQANAREVSWSHIQEGRQGLTPARKAPLLTNPATPRQSPIPESDWMHAIVDDMNQWTEQSSVFYSPVPFGFENASTPIGLVGGLKRAVLDAPSRDFAAASLLLTHPQASVGELFKTYTYSAKVSVGLGKETFHAFYNGTGTASWTATWSRVWIAVDRARRLVITPTSLSTDGVIHPNTLGDAVSASFTGSASGNWTDNGGHTCSYAGLTPSGQDRLRGAGGDTYGKVHPYLVEDSYQFAGTFGIVFSNDGAYSSGGTCTNSDGSDAGSPDPFQPFVGADLCNTPYESRSLGVPVPAWDLGKAQIHVESSFSGDLTGGCAIKGYPSDAISTGTYVLDLTRTPGT